LIDWCLKWLYYFYSIGVGGFIKQSVQSSFKMQAGKMSKIYSCTILKAITDVINDCVTWMKFLGFKMK
jgi:hypothetical protein